MSLAQHLPALQVVLPLISAPDLGDPNLANYATYYRGVAQIGLGRHDEALTTLSLLAARPLDGALKELATLQLAGRPS